MLLASASPSRGGLLLPTLGELRHGGHWFSPAGDQMRLIRGPGRRRLSRQDNRFGARLWVAFPGQGHRGAEPRLAGPLPHGTNTLGQLRRRRPASQGSVGEQDRSRLDHRGAISLFRAVEGRTIHPLLDPNQLPTPWGSLTTISTGSSIKGQRTTPNGPAALNRHLVSQAEPPAGKPQLSGRTCARASRKSHPVIYPVMGRHSGTAVARNRWFVAA